MPSSLRLLVPSLLLLSTLGGTVFADGGRMARKARAELGVGRFDAQKLELPAEGGEAFLVEVELEGIARRLLLERFSLRAPGADVRVVGHAATRDVPAPPVRTYRGRVLGEPGTSVVASLGEAGLTVDVVSGRGLAWSVRPLREVLPRAARARHAVFAAEDLLADPVLCGLEVVAGPGGSPTEAPGVPIPVCQTFAQIAFDADFDYYQDQGSSVEATVARIDAHMNTVDFFYARDVRITHRITKYVVRTAPFYAPTGGGHLLDLFRAEWNQNQTDVVRDLAHLMTGKPGSLIEFGGLAFVGVVCTSSHYGWSMDGANIVGHEIGHNWGAGHCHDATPCNNMCGACFYIAPNTKAIIEAFRDSRGCVRPELAYSAPLPPYAEPEGASLRKEAFEGAPALVFDVLGNDHDGNCDALSIDAFDATSVQGGTVALSAGSGPGGRDELVYALPSIPFVGADTFGYTVGDGNGGQTAGTVTVELEALDLLGYWRVDEGAGSVAADASVHGHDGALAGGTTWTTGFHDGGVAFDGTGDAVAVPPLELFSDRATITAWLRREGAQSAFAGIVFSRDASSVAGMNFGFANELRYHWNDSNTTWTFDSGLVPPDGQWVLVALVVEPERATLHMHDGTLASAVNHVAHGVEEFDGTLHLGWDPVAAARSLGGRLDDVRFYDQALTAAELDELWQDGGRAEGPDPRDGGVRIDPAGALTWVASPVADAHRVYLGADYAAVRDATPASPEYQGTVTSPELFPGALAAGTTWFWRVDEEVGAGVVEGRVWQFEPAWFHHWKLDETSGVVAADSQGGVDGDYIDGVVLGRPGAATGTGTAVGFDGVNDRVRFQDLDLFTDRLTITVWVRRDGPQDSFAGLVFNRDLSTVAGLNFGDANELRYHWNGSSSTWSWDSGLVVPDATWVFAALVVEPDRATIHLGDGGVLTSATNLVSHGSEEFDGRTFLGRDSNGGARYFQGDLDDCRIYEAALTPTEVEALYQSALRAGPATTKAKRTERP